MTEYLRYFDGLRTSTQVLFALVVIFFLIVFKNVIRDNFADFILVLSGKKKITDISLVKGEAKEQKPAGIQIKVVYLFPANCMIAVAGFFQWLNGKVQKHRTAGEEVVFDLAECECCNSAFIKDFIELLREMIEKNNVKCSIIFPKSDAFNSVDEWLDREIARTGSKSIMKWKDKR